MPPLHDHRASRDATVRETAAVADPCGAIATATASKTEAEANGLRRDKDWADLCRYAADDMAVTGSVKLVLIGDSLTEGRQKA